MAKTNTISTAARFPAGEAETHPMGASARHPQGDALAPHAGAAQPPLDLSLGHIGTIEAVSPSDVEVQDMGPFRVVFDYSTMTGKVFTDTSAFACRADRRAAERKFHKEALRIGREMGFAISMGGGHE